MRIVEDSPDRLVLSARTDWLSLGFVAAAAFLVVRVVRGQEKAALLVAASVFLVFALLLFRSSRLTVDKAARVVRLARREVFGVTRRDVPFADVRDVAIDVTTGFGESNGPLYRLRLVTTAESLLLTSAYEPGHDHALRLREAVLAALGRAADPPPDPIDALLAAGRKLDAIKLLRMRQKLGLAEAKALIDARMKSL